MPLLLPLAVPFFALMAALVLAGLAKSMTAQHGSTNSGTFWDYITGRAYLSQLSGFAASFARWIVSHFAASQLRMLTRWFIGIGTLTIGWFTGNAAFSEEIVGAVERVLHRGDPRARAKAQAANQHAVHAGRTATHANTHARSVGHDLTRYKGLTNARVHHLTHAVDIALPHDIARVRAREKALSRDQAKLWKRTKLLEHGAIRTFDWIRAHPLGAAAGVFSAAIAVVLPRLGLDFLRCPGRSDVGGKRGCALWDLLGNLLGLAGFLTLAFDFQAFVSAADTVASGIGKSVASIEGTFDLSLPPLPPPKGG